MTFLFSAGTSDDLGQVLELCVALCLNVVACVSAGAQIKLVASIAQISALLVLSGGSALDATWILLFYSAELRLARAQVLVSGCS